MAIFGFLDGHSKKKWNKGDCFMVGEKLAQFHLANLKAGIINGNFIEMLRK